MTNSSVDLILFNGKITTLDSKQPDISAIGIKDGKVASIGSDEEVKKISK